MLRGKVAFRGRFVATDEFDRGEPILLSAEEWSRRGKVTSDRYIEWYSCALIFTILPIWLLIAMIIGTADLFWVIYPPIYCVSLVAVNVLVINYFRRHEVEQRTYTGLFERGIQNRVPGGKVFLFVPYHLIRDFRVDEGWLLSKLVLDIEGFGRPIKLVHTPNTLGDDGLMLLRRMLTMTPEPEGPPRLVLYNEGGKSVVDRDPVLPKYDVRSQL